MKRAVIRPATLTDIAAILAIYNDVIATSTAIYMDEPVTLANREAWYADRQRAGYPVLVAMVEGVVAGLGSFGDFRAFPGYRFSVEHSVHVAATARGAGVGTALVEALLPLAANMGKHVMIGAIDADNDASIRFHAHLGFAKVAHMPQVGFKFGRWLDLVFMQRLV